MSHYLVFLCSAQYPRAAWTSSSYPLGDALSATNSNTSRLLAAQRSVTTAAAGPESSIPEITSPPPLLGVDGPHIGLHPVPHRIVHRPNGTGSQVLPTQAIRPSPNCPMIPPSSKHGSPSNVIARMAQALHQCTCIPGCTHSSHPPRRTAKQLPARHFIM